MNWKSTNWNWDAWLYNATRANMRTDIRALWIFLFVVSAAINGYTERETIRANPAEAFVLFIFYMICATVVSKIHTEVCLFILKSFDMNLNRPGLFLSTLSFFSIFPLLSKKARESLRAEHQRRTCPQEVASAPEPALPEDPEVAKARAIAEIEMQKAEHMARLRIAEAKGLAGVAAEVARTEEERQRRQLEELKKL